MINISRFSNLINNQDEIYLMTMILSERDDFIRGRFSQLFKFTATLSLNQSSVTRLRILLLKLRTIFKKLCHQTPQKLTWLTEKVGIFLIFFHRWCFFPGSSFNMCKVDGAENQL